MPNPRLWIDADQQNSAVAKNAPQNDRWRAEEITPHRTPPFTLIVVADGEGGQGAGEVANQAVGIAFAEAMLRRDDPLPRLLRHLVSQMNEVISQRGTDTLVGLTLGAVQGDTLYLIQAGAQIPGDVEVVLLENTPTVVHAVMPPRTDMARFQSRFDAAVKRLYDMPDSVEVRVHRDSPTRIFVVIPGAAAAPARGEMTDKQLEQVAGGKTATAAVQTVVGSVTAEVSLCCPGPGAGGWLRVPERQSSPMPSSKAVIRPGGGATRK